MFALLETPEAYDPEDAFEEEAYEELPENFENFDEAAAEEPPAPLGLEAFPEELEPFPEELEPLPEEVSEFPEEVPDAPAFRSDPPRSFLGSQPAPKVAPGRPTARTPTTEARFAPLKSLAERKRPLESAPKPGPGKGTRAGIGFRPSAPKAAPPGVPVPEDAGWLEQGVEDEVWDPKPSSPAPKLYGAAPSATRPRINTPHFAQSQRGAALVTPAPKPQMAPAGFSGRMAAGPPHLSLRWVTIPDSSTLVQQGYPAMAPALIFSAELHGLLCGGNYLLYDLAGEAMASEVVLNHDAEWNLFPEVGNSLKSFGCEEICMCIAVCPGQAKWAVGLGNKWKQREQAARLALCVALAANAPSLSGPIQRNPEFGSLCEAAGIATEDNPNAVAPQMVARPQPTAVSQGPTKKAKTAPAQAANGSFWQHVPEPAPQALGGTMRDHPFWLLIPEQSAGELQGLDPRGLAVSTEGGRKSLYNLADTALERLLGPPGTEEVNFLDDANWEHFPEVGAALKASTSVEECMCVGICPSRGVWAVGVGMKGKIRFAAAKLAMAGCLALQALDLQEALDLSGLQEFEQFLQEASAAR